jgi:hypothetical protein
MSGHRLTADDEPNNVFRLKIYNGCEYHVIAPTLYEALEVFKTHPAWDKRITTATLVARIDL